VQHQWKHTAPEQGPTSAAPTLTSNSGSWRLKPTVEGASQPREIHTSSGTTSTEEDADERTRQRGDKCHGPIRRHGCLGTELYFCSAMTGIFSDR